MRSDGSKDREQLLTEEQKRLASGIRALLSAAQVSFDEHVESNGSESWYRMDLRVASPLSAGVFIAVDVFQLIVNAADLRLGSQDSDDWVGECLRVFESLLEADLRLRIRRKLLGGTTGAIWIPLGEGYWNGDFLAYLGMGREHCFKNWHSANPDG